MDREKWTAGGEKAGHQSPVISRTAVCRVTRVVPLAEVGLFPTVGGLEVLTKCLEPTLGRVQLNHQRLFISAG